MPYSKFDLPRVQQELGLTLQETRHFLPDLPRVEPDDLLTADP